MGQVTQVHFLGVNFFRQGACKGRSTPLYILDPLISRKLLEPES